MVGVAPSASQDLRHRRRQHSPMAIVPAVRPSTLRRYHRCFPASEVLPPVDVLPEVELLSPRERDVADAQRPPPPSPEVVTTRGRERRRGAHGMVHFSTR